MGRVLDIVPDEKRKVSIILRRKFSTTHCLPIGTAVDQRNALLWKSVLPSSFAGAWYGTTRIGDTVSLRLPCRGGGSSNDDKVLPRSGRRMSFFVDMLPLVCAARAMIVLARMSVARLWRDKWIGECVGCAVQCSCCAV